MGERQITALPDSIAGRWPRNVQLAYLKVEAVVHAG